jgi:hypothetical protein
MTIRVNEWYRVKATGQYCCIQKIPSTTDPRVSLPMATENTRGFELALTWYAPGDGTMEKWTKRVMILDKKAMGLFREPNEEDWPAIEKIKSISHRIPIASASRDGEFTLPVEGT